MSALNLLRTWKENNPQVKNIVLFVSDALRWDYTPKSVMSRGVTFRTIASGIWTPPSISSIISGLYPPHHGIRSWADRLPRSISSILNLQGYNISVWTENTWTGSDPPESSPFYKILQHRNRVPLEELEPPFIYLEDEKGGHCPYGWSVADEEYEEWDCNAFFRDYGKREKEMLRKRYQKGVERSVQEFHDRMREIEERGLKENTLVIFLSDHGELLGEYGGIVGHSNVTAPEVVYVPTVFIHPNLPKGKSFEKEGVFRHVDLYPTICDILSKPIIKKVDGVSLFNIEKLPDFGYTYSRWHRTNSLISYDLKELSVWDKDGGYLFREGTGLMLRLLRAIHITFLSNSNNCAIYQRERIKRTALPDFLKKYSATLRCFCSSFIKYGFPSLSLKKARALKVDLESMSVNDISRKVTKEEEPPNAFSQEEEEKIKERLRRLGYL